MKHHKKNCLVILSLILCMLMHIASAAPVVSIEPASIEVTQGDSYTIQIMVDPAGFEICGSGYELGFDNSLLYAVDQNQGTFLNQDGESTINIRNDINNSIGVIEYGEMRTGVEYGVSDQGILAQILFNATGSGVCDLVLNEVILSELITTDPTEIPDVVIQNGVCRIISADQTTDPTDTVHETTATASRSSSDITPPLPGIATHDTNETSSPTQMPIQGSLDTEEHSSKDSRQEESDFVSPLVVTGLFIVAYLTSNKKS